MRWDFPLWKYERQNCIRKKQTRNDGRHISTTKSITNKIIYKCW